MPVINRGGNASYQSPLSFLSRRAVRTARLTIAAAMPVINRGGNTIYQSPPSFLSHGAPCARRGFYRGGNAGYQSIRRAIFSIAARRAHGAVNYRGNDGGAAAYWRRRQCRLSIAAIFSIARRAVRTARFLSRRQCVINLPNTPRGNASYQSIRRAIFSIAAMTARQCCYLSPPSFLSHGAPCARRGFYRGGNALSIYPARHLFYRGNDGGARRISGAAYPALQHYRRHFFYYDKMPNCNATSHNIFACFGGGCFCG